MKEKISIIIPCYNVEKYVGECIKSITDQTYDHNIECIIIDDGSTDETGKIIDRTVDEYRKDGGPIHFIVKHTENGGCGRARNIGLGLCTGEWIMLIDSDDSLTKDALELFVKKIEEDPTYDYIQSSAYDISLSPNIKATPERYSMDRYETEYRGFDCQRILYDTRPQCHVTPWAKLYRKEVIGEETYNEALKSDDDLDFNMRVWMNVKHMGVIKERTYMRNRREEGIVATTTNERRASSRSTIMKYALTHFIPMGPYIFLRYFHNYYASLFKAQTIYNPTIMRTTKSILMYFKLDNLASLIQDGTEWMTAQIPALISDTQHEIGEQPKETNKNDSTKVALVAMCKLENHYLTEWLTYHRGLGFDKIFLIDNNDTEGPNKESIYDLQTVNDGIADGWLEIYPLNNERHLQQCIYSKIYNKEKNNYEWFLFLDIDEFLTLTESTDVHDFLKRGRYKNYNLIRLIWKNYGDSGLVYVRDGNYNLRERFTEPCGGTCGVKCFVKSVPTDEVLFPSPHTAIHVGTLACNSNGDIIYDVNGHTNLGKETYNFAYIAHYITKTAEEFAETKLKRGGSAQPLIGISTKYTPEFFFRFNKRTKDKENYLYHFAKSNIAPFNENSSLSEIKENLKKNLSSSQCLKMILNKKIDLLKTINQVCQKHGIIYYAYNELLLNTMLNRPSKANMGIDVVMTRKNYDKFMSVINDELNGTQYVCCSPETTLSPDTITRIVDTTTTHIDSPLTVDAIQYIGYIAGINVKIFVIDNAPQDKTEREEFFRELNNIRAGLQSLFKEAILTAQNGKEISPIKTKYNKAAKQFLKKCKQYDNEDCYVLVETSSDPQNTMILGRNNCITFIKPWFYTTEKKPIQQCDIEIPVPIGANHILNNIFNNSDNQTIAENINAHFTDPLKSYKDYAATTI